MHVHTGENSLRVHELMQEVQELQKSKQELNDQVEHWRYRAQEVLEQKALDVMKADQSQGTSATEDILLDIKKLQQVFSCCMRLVLSTVHLKTFCCLHECFCRARHTGDSRQRHWCMSMRRPRAMFAR